MTKQRKLEYSIIRKNHIRKIKRTFPKISNPDFLWYERAKDFAEGIHPNLLVAAGVIAALSPRQIWKVNAAWAKRACQTWAHNQTVPNIGTMSVRNKTRRILELESPSVDAILTILNGDKTKRFFLNIIGYTDPVTIDKWMLEFLGMPEKPGTAMYRRAESNFQKAAQILGVPPRNLQSALWVHVRGSHE